MVEFSGKALVIGLVVIFSNLIFGAVVPSEICGDENYEQNVSDTADEIQGKSILPDIPDTGITAIDAILFGLLAIPAILAALVDAATFLFDAALEFFELLLFQGIGECLPGPFDTAWNLGMVIIVLFAFLDLAGYIRELVGFSS